MAKQYHNDKGFLVIELTPLDFVVLTGGRYPLCDLCGAELQMGYYIAYIDQVYDKRCYDAYMQGAIRYKTDIATEKARYESKKKLYKSLELWNE